MDIGARERRKSISCQLRKESRRKHRHTLYSPSDATAAVVHEILFENNVTLEEIKVTLNGMALSLSVKRQVLEELNFNEMWKKKQERLPLYKRVAYSLLLRSRRITRIIQDASVWKVWQPNIKSVEGYFGPSVASYFDFVRIHHNLNFVFFLIIFLFLVLPQFFYSLLWSESRDDNHTAAFTGKELLTGTGVFSNSLLYYGHYSNGTIGDGFMSYDLSKAYFLTMVAYYFCWLLVLSYRLANKYQEASVESFTSSRYSILTKIFVAWDHSIDNDKAAQLKHAIIQRQLKKDLRSRNNRCSFTSLTNVKRIMSIIFVNLFVLATMAVIGYLVASMAKDRNSRIGAPKTFLEEMSMAVVITAFHFVMPRLYFFLSGYECHSGNRRLYSTFIRIALLDIIMLAIVVWVFREASEGPSSSLTCLETEFGEEMYRLLMVQSLSLLLPCEYVISIIQRKGHELFPTLVPPSVFPIGIKRLNVIFMQTIVWLGTFYSPLLPVVILITLPSLYYLKRVTIATTYDLSYELWPSAQVITLFLSIIFFNFICAFNTFLHGMFSANPSQICGPFKHLQKRYNSIVTFEKETSSGKVLKQRFPTEFLYIIVVLLCILIHYMRVRAKSYNDMVSTLRKRLATEQRNTNVLAKLVSKIADSKEESPEREVKNICDSLKANRRKTLLLLHRLK